MKVLVYADDVLGVHYATNLEIAARHLDQGDEVHLLVCHGDLGSCPSNSLHDRRICILCKSKQASGLANDLMARVRRHVLDLSGYMMLSLPEFDSVEDLKEYSIDGINHGMEAASSLISIYRDPKPDMDERRRTARGSLFTAVALYRESLRILDEIKPDLCYLLNGRRASQMPVVRALREKQIRFYTFEVGHNWKKYILIEGTYFHDLENKKQEIEKYWNDSTPQDEKERLARQFFHDRRFGSGDDYPEAVYKRNQNRGVLPAGFDPCKRNIAIFNSSEDEFAAIEGYENPVYKNQIEGLNRITHSPKIDPEIRLYLRVHPNLGTISNHQTESIKTLHADNLVVIPATANVDSYALMEASEKVLTFGSAMSIESAYAGKPSILIGREPYEAVGACYTPETHEQAISLLNDRNLPALPTLGALKYGYYMVARDVSYQYFDPTTNTFMGRKLEPSLFATKTVKSLREGHLRRVNDWKRYILDQIGFARRF
jgi:hypothetical protein